jgi:hypothetical protein
MKEKYNVYDVVINVELFTKMDKDEDFKKNMVDLAMDSVAHSFKVTLDSSILKLKN